MTERKPPGYSFETWVERQIREAMERGEFDDLPGAGKPIPDLSADDENWWIKRKLRQEGVSAEAALPTPLRLRKEIERLPETVRGLATERAVREVVADLNRRILEWVRAPVGPAVVVVPVDAEHVVARWREDRG
jgi:Domain of unknown function (DUF1992)